MYLKRLELTGFKSFANPAVLEFPKPDGDNFNITAIVGPNGSGKSNCAESIRWALGEQSLKMLRGKKSHDIIFSGSKQKRRLNTAEVTLHFNNEDGVASIEYKEFTITRRIYRGDECEYRINKSRTRLQDILILLARANFGQKSYSIIGQGMIDQILVSSPQERKNFFDEATGIKQYIYKRDKALKKIDKSKENLTQASIALHEIAPHLHSLTRQINKLSKRKQVQKKLHTLQRQYYGIKWHDLENQILRLKKQTNTKIKKQKQLEKNLNEYNKESRTLAYEKPDDAYEKLQQQHSRIIQKRDEYFSAQSRLRARLAYLQEKIKQNQSTTTVSINTEKLFTDLKNIQAMQESFLKQLKNAANLELKSLQKSANTIFEKLKQILSYFHRDSSLRNQDKQTIKNIQKDLQNIDTDISQSNKELKQINKELSQITYKEQDKRKELLQWQTKIQNKQYELTVLTNDINEIKINIARLETRKESLEIEIKNEAEIPAEKLLTSYDDIKPETIEYEEIQKLRRQLELIGGIDPEVEKEYPSVKERYEFLSSQSADLKKTLKSLNAVISELNQKIKQGFTANFAKINAEFDKYFKIIFGGGSAKIVLQETPELKYPSSVISLDKEKKEGEYDREYTETTLAVDGIDIFASPPGKKIKTIEMLSGGEKALTSLALICAIISINKPPFVVLDEVDAALDQENSLRFAQILKELQRHTQFIIITHNQQTIEIADILYGVSMSKDGVSKLMSLKLE